MKEKLLHPPRRTLTLFAVLMIGVLIGAVPVLYSQVNGRDEVGAQAVPTPQFGFGGTVVYYIHAGNAGRAIGATTSSMTLTEITPAMRVTIKNIWKSMIKVEVKLCMELAVADTEEPVGLLAAIDGNAMYPNVGGPGGGYLAGYVAHPSLGAVYNYAALESWCFDWEGQVGYGVHVISFYWAVSDPDSILWGDFYAISVWATKVV